jgi:hypothetical protein
MVSELSQVMPSFICLDGRKALGLKVQVMEEQEGKRDSKTAQ